MERYETPEMEIVLLGCEDIITASCRDDQGDTHLPVVPA